MQEGAKYWFLKKTRCQEGNLAAQKTGRQAGTQILNKHNAELRRSAPGSKVSYRMFSYVSPPPQRKKNMVNNENFIRYFLIQF